MGGSGGPPCSLPGRAALSFSLYLYLSLLLSACLAHDPAGCLARPGPIRLWAGSPLLTAGRSHPLHNLRLVYVSSIVHPYLLPSHTSFPRPLPPSSVFLSSLLAWLFGSPSCSLRTHEPCNPPPIVRRLSSSSYTRGGLSSFLPSLLPPSCVYPRTFSPIFRKLCLSCLLPSRPPPPRLPHCLRSTTGQF